MKNVTYINAGAGSGKTHRLTETLIRLIKDGKTRPDQVILTTYTTKAAGEFREKAKAALFDEGMYEEAMQLDHAMIGTVHSVCQRMIGKYWLNLGLSPDMRVMGEDDASYYISQSLADLPTEAELRILHGFAKEFDIHEKDRYVVKSTIDYDFWKEHLKSVIDYATNYELDDFVRSEEESLGYIRRLVRPGVSIAISDEEVEAMLGEARRFVADSNRIKKKDDYYAAFDEIQNTARGRSIVWYKKVQKTLKATWGPVCAEVAERLEGLWTSPEVYEKQEGYIRLLFGLAARWRENFAQFKREKNLIDYNDMEKYMNRLLQDGAVSSEIARSYRYLFVDEFQDSSPIQVKIFDALSDLMEHSYWVGDYKQAIFGFRGADVALTKAVVDRIARKEDGCDTDTLRTSWRSLPDIVDLNNEVFERTFSSVLDKKNIHLDRHRENVGGIDSLRYFVSREDAGIAEHILALLNQGVKPGDIAVLARDREGENSTLSVTARALRDHGIPCNLAETPITDSLTVMLIEAMLKVVSSAKDSLAKATVAYLTEKDRDTRSLIESKILHDADASAEAEGYLSDVPLVRRLLSIRPRLQQQSVASLVETMIIELGLYDEIKKLEDDPAFGISCLQTVITTARAYEEHCVQMNLPATIDGFIAYVEEVKPAGGGDPDGVQLHTYHSCKGLQWKYVVMTSLNADVSNIKKAVKREMYGVHSVHDGEPSTSNPYPEVYVRLTPWVYGSSTNVPEEISAMIEGTEDFRSAYRAMLAEANRLFYVGMTRPKDVLILSIDEPKRGATLLKWAKDIGLDKVSGTVPEAGDWDVFGNGIQFHSCTLSAEDLESLGDYAAEDVTLRMAVEIGKHPERKPGLRYVSPSSLHARGDVLSSHDFQARIPFAKQPSDMSVVGDCIHQIYAGIDEGVNAGVDSIVEGYRLQGVFGDRDSVIRAWENLEGYLTSAHGTAVRTCHERPFRLERDGQTVVGSIDLVWKTSEGDVLVDFKTCPMGAGAVLDAASEHYAGWYAGQLDAYAEALEAAGEKVLKRYIYYPVSGLLVEVGPASL